MHLNRNEYYRNDFYIFQGDTIASCDSKGIVKLWDVRTVKSIVTLDFGPYSANSVSFHPAGRKKNFILKIK